jgi:hypothetical protein
MCGANADIERGFFNAIKSESTARANACVESTAVACLDRFAARFNLGTIVSGEPARNS